VYAKYTCKYPLNERAAGSCMYSSLWLCCWGVFHRGEPAPAGTLPSRAASKNPPQTVSVHLQMAFPKKNVGRRFYMTRMQGMGRRPALPPTGRPTSGMSVLPRASYSRTGPYSVISCSRHYLHVTDKGNISQVYRSSSSSSSNCLGATRNRPAQVRYCVE
jgi:hypothetical protein